MEELVPELAEWAHWCPERGHRGQLSCRWNRTRLECQLGKQLLCSPGPRGVGVVGSRCATVMAVDGGLGTGWGQAEPRTSPATAVSGCRTTEPPCRSAGGGRGIGGIGMVEQGRCTTGARRFAVATPGAGVCVARWALGWKGRRRRAGEVRRWRGCSRSRCMPSAMDLGCSWMMVRWEGMSEFPTRGPDVGSPVHDGLLKMK